MTNVSAEALRFLRGETKRLVYRRYEAATSRRQRADGWRLLELPKFESCEILDETFPGSRGASHQRHYTWDMLFARVT